MPQSRPRKPAPAKRDYRVLARYFIVILAMLLSAAAIVRNLAGTTVTYAHKWNERVEREFSQREPILPNRGNLLADDGTIIATNMQFYQVRIDFRSGPFDEARCLAALDSLSDSLALHFPIHDRAYWHAFFADQLAKPKGARGNLMLLDGISYADYLKLRTFPFLNIPSRIKCGIKRDDYDRRVYPYGSMARRSIGMVDTRREDPEPHGRWGLERALDSLLYGTPGTARKVALTKSVEKWVETPPLDGYDITTTIDINLQEMVDQELQQGLDYCGAEWGTAVLMEVATGDIKAISNLKWSDRAQAYIESENWAVQRFEPGSVVKVLSMIVALEDGIVKSENTTVETGALWPYEGAKPIKDTHVSAVKNAREVISHSSNIGMAKLITSRYAANPPKWRERLAAMGLFEPMRSGISGEVCPLVPEQPDTKAGRIGLSRQSYGYTTAFSPLWTLAIYNAVANDGRFVRPRLMSRISRDGVDSVIPVDYIRPSICTPEHARWLREWLVDVIQNPQGTAPGLRNSLVPLAGKTGTCLTIDPDTKKYIEGQYRLAFCGFFPALEPRYSCIVLVCKPTRNAFGAAGTSGNIFRAIAHKLYARGLLGPKCDTADGLLSSTHPKAPTFYASLDPERTRQARSQFALLDTPVGLIKEPGAVASGVPDVRGLGLRDAVAALESHGYDVEASGAGVVSRQEPAPGQALARGKCVKLSLIP